MRVSLALEIGMTPCWRRRVSTLPSAAGFYPTYRDAGDDVEDETAPLGAYLASCSDAISANGHLLAR